MSEDERSTLDRLAQLRDELRLKIHLGAAEARDQWQALEDRWPEVQRTVHRLEEASAESAGEVKAAAKLLLEEVGEGYDRIRKSL